MQLEMKVLAKYVAISFPNNLSYGIFGFGLI